MAKKEPKQGPVTVRLLLEMPINGVAYKGDQLLVVEGSLAAQLLEAGAADDHPDSVAYLVGLGVQPVTHVAPAAEA